MATLNRNLYHVTVQHPTEWQADTWNTESKSGNIVPQTWSKPFMKSSTERPKIAAEHGHFKKQSASYYCASSHQISGWYPKHLKS